MVGDAAGDYYGESSGSFMVKEFADEDQLQEIIYLASQPIPERPDGIVVVVKYSSAQSDACQSTEAEYERLARANPASIFLRNMKEYENAALLQSQQDVQTLPTHDIYYQGSRVRRIEGSNVAELDDAVNQYQFMNSELDLFSEEAKYNRDQSWGESAKRANTTPRTTNRFVPGYDWNKKTGAFDEAGGKAQQSFEDAFGGWLPNVDEDE
ncbi:MAG: hypothetical protein SGILL_002868 [Bacillariaceae sp.]